MEMQERIVRKNLKKGANPKLRKKRSHRAAVRHRITKMLYYDIVIMKCTHEHHHPHSAQIAFCLPREVI